MFQAAAAFWAGGYSALAIQLLYLILVVLGLYPAWRACAEIACAAPRSRRASLALRTAVLPGVFVAVIASLPLDPWMRFFAAAPLLPALLVLAALAALPDSERTDEKWVGGVFS